MSEPIRTADGHVLDAVETAAYEAMMSRVEWPSMHWGVEGVHRDAWPHLAIAAATGARSEVERLRAQVATPDEREAVATIEQIAALIDPDAWNLSDEDYFAEYDDGMHGMGYCLAGRNARRRASIHKAKQVAALAAGAGEEWHGTRPAPTVIGNPVLADALRYYAERRTMNNPKGWDHVQRKIEQAATANPWGASAEQIVEARAVIARLIESEVAPTVDAEVVEDMAAALALLLYDAHPTYGSTAGWRGGIGGQAITQGCNVVDPSPGAEWAQYDLLSEPLRRYMGAHPGFDLTASKERVKAAAITALGLTVTDEEVGS